MLGMKKKKNPQQANWKTTTKKACPQMGEKKKKGKNKEIKTYITFCFDGMNSI